MTPNGGDLKKMIGELRDLMPGITKREMVKGGPGSGRYPAGSGEKPSTSSYSEHKVAVRNRMSQLSAEDKAKLKESASAIFYRQEDQKANYEKIERILAAKYGDVSIDTVTAILGVDSILEEQKASSTGDISKYISHEGDQWTVYSEAGKPMGTYDSEDAAKHRLQQIEYFKNVKKSFEQMYGLLKTFELNKDVMNSYPNVPHRGEVRIPPVLQDTTAGQIIRIPGSTTGQGAEGGGGGIGSGGATNPN